MASASPRPLRADAERNRVRVLDAARRVLAERGLDATTTDDVARAAGVGVGTVYRRFPTKEALIAAALDELATELLEAVAGAIGGGGGGSSEPAVPADAWLTVRAALEALAAGLHANRAFIEAVYERIGEQQPLQPFRVELQRLLRPVFARAHAAGVLRADVVVEDVPLLVVSVARLAPKRPEVDPLLYRRYLGVLLDGLRSEAATPLALAPPPA